MCTMMNSNVSVHSFIGNDRVAVNKLGTNKNRLNSVGNESIGDDVSCCKCFRQV